MRRRVVDQVAGPHRHFHDRGQTAVPVGVVPGAVPGIVRHARVRRVRARLGHHMHPGPGGRPARRVRGPRLHRNVQLRRGLGERLRQPRHILRQLHPAAAQIGPVEGRLEVGTQLVDDPGEGTCLGRQPVGWQHGGRPLRLLGSGGAEEPAVVVEQGPWRGSHMKTRPVRIRTQQKVPRGVGPQLPLVQHPFSQREESGTPGGLIGVSPRDHQHGPLGMPKGQQMQRSPGPRDPDLLERAQPWLLSRQRPGGRDDFGHTGVVPLRQETHPRLGPPCAAIRSTPRTG